MDDMKLYKAEQVRRWGEYAERCPFRNPVRNPENIHPQGKPACGLGGIYPIEVIPCEYGACFAMFVRHMPCF